LWFLEKLHPHNLAYQFQSILRFHGQLDIPVLEKSLNLLVQRHEILRTSFPQSGGRPFQHIHPFAPFTLCTEDVGASEAELRISRIIREPFDWERMPPVRWMLFRIAAAEHWLLRVEHHVLHDGWEYEIFLRELFECYDALTANRAPALPPLTVQFADFAIWQRRQLAAGRWDRQLDYWHERLQAPPPATQLPADRPRTRDQTFAGAQFRQPFTGEFYAQLLAASASEGVTPYMWLHAAFHAFLFRYTGQTDVIVGTGVANRQSAEAQKLLGMIINTVALRISFSGEPTFRDVLSRVRHTTLEAIDNQDAPFDHVIQRLGPGTVLFNSFFDTYDKPYPSYQNDVLRVDHRIGINNGTCKFDIVALVVANEETPAILLWEYNTDLFTQETASRMMRHFLALLTASVANPELPAAALPMMSSDERMSIIGMGAGKKDVLMRDRRLHEIFAGVAAARPDAVAIICRDTQLSYREFDKRAQTLSDQLRAAGARPGEVVAFSLPRGAQALCAMLAILKCDCAYLPLNPKLPKARRQLLLQIAGSMLLVTTEGIVRLKSGRPPFPNPLLEDAAYVLFTSGSTGSPKAVCVPHRAVARLVCNVDYISLDAGTRFLQLAPLSFDASTLEIWGPLLNGGTVVIHPQDLPEFAELGRTIADHGVTTAWLTASLFNQVIDSAPEILRPLRQLLSGGEALSVTHVVRGLDALPSTTLINGYGPTEATTFSTTFRIPREFDATSRRVPIGRPLPDTQVYVLDERRQLLPIGVPGEIFIGGTGLASGYLGDEVLTEAKFVQDTISGRPGARLYRTGDRGRLLPDGTLDFIERLDRQVKIRGFRIEPGEIESVLAQHPSVRDAAVAAWNGGAAQRELIAYVVATPGHETGNLRRFLQERLPDYMVPAKIVVLDALPMTPSGKLDLQALRSGSVDEDKGEDSVREWVAPRTPLEQVLAGIWANTLKMERVGVHDDFFALGGHSLLALQLMHEMNTAFGVELPVRLLFTAPTVAGQAREIERVRAAPDGQQHATYPLLVPLRSRGTKPPFFLVAGGFGGEAELIVYAGLVRYLDSRRPFYGLRIRGVDDLVEPDETVEAMAAEHVAEIRKIQPRGPYFIGGACVGGVVALEIAQQLRAQGESMGSLILLDSRYPSWGWLLRYRLWRVSHLEVMPLMASWRQGQAQFLALLKTKINALATPSAQIRFGLQYLRRLLRYIPQPYPGPVTLIVCEARRARNPTWVWRDVARGGLDIHYVPGDHDTHLHEHAAVTAAQLDSCLEAAHSRLRHTAPSAAGRRDVARAGHGFRRRGGHFSN
jgi:aspartate racemase